MANYKIVVKKSVSKDLRSIPNRDVARIVECIGTLREEPQPRGCEKLTGGERYRIRVGRYRIVYEILDRQLIVTVVTVGHRKQVYRST